MAKASMAKPRWGRGLGRTAGWLLLASGLTLELPAQSQTLITGGCPWLVPVRQRELQPKRLHPAEVPGKNARGCLSPHDAVYGPDGCPLRLCGPEAGVLPLPPPETSGP
ncbi:MULTISPECIES: hypothetical protein [Aphanothece]|uniref:hypothetical protein n=1 Tax=Aphanothece TaxID=1121 RepID=UPI0039849D1C